MTSTACWRGHACHYAVRNARFVLAKLEINPGGAGDAESEPDDIPRLAGRSIARDPAKHAFFSHRFEDVNLPTPFTGGLLLGDGFVDSLYEHMGFHPAWK